MFYTREDIEYKAAPYGYIATIPAGTPCQPASNLPDGDEGPRYWVETWKGMSDEARAWGEGYGFLVSAGEVVETVAQSYGFVSSSPPRGR